MKRLLACLATLAVSVFATAAQADTTPAAAPTPAPASAPAPSSDPVGDLIGSAIRGALAGPGDFQLKATLYHAGARGIRALDSLGCRLVAMRTVAVDGVKVPRHTVLFIKETVGMPLPDGSRHDGYWYASDVGGAIHAGRIDLFTGQGAGSMRPLMALNLAQLTVTRVGAFKGCPPG